MPIVIRPAAPSDVDAMWDLFREAAAGGDTLPTCESASLGAVENEWFDGPIRSFVATEGDVVVGMYKLGANQADRGSHVASATFVVAAAARARGIGALLVEDCLDQARRAGFAAMQFNFVVATNGPALALYRRFGFSVIGTLPAAFRHRQLGLVDALILFKTL